MRITMQFHADRQKLRCAPLWPSGELRRYIQKVYRSEK